MASPTLSKYDAAHTDAVVLMLHGGKPRSRQAVDGRSASWRRSAWMARTLAPDLQTHGAATWLLRYRERGWNGGAAPVADARWALDEVRSTLGQVPVVLLGHSMGARVAVHAADDPSVVGVVGLAPWWSSDDPVDTVAGKTLLAAHGRRDRITSFRETAAYVERARSVARRAELRDMGGLGHYMLTGVAAWNATALELVDAALESISRSGG